MDKKSKLIGEGSHGCVFKPALPCKTKKYNPNNKKVSKLVFSNNYQQEIKINKLISSIPNHEKWSQIWTESCNPHTKKYLLQISELKDCLNYPHDKQFKNMQKLLIGKYTGISLLKYSLKIFKKKTFANQKLFLKAFLRFFKLMKSLFLAIHELYIHQICHQDINYHNITYQSQQLKLIDYGISFQFKNSTKATQRINRELKLDRIYLAYPYQYLYHTKNKNILKNEIINHSSSIHKYNHDTYLFIHEKIFQRKNIHQEISDLINQNSQSLENNLSQLIESLDTYSLGMLIPTLLIKICEEYHSIQKDKLIPLLHQKTILPYCNDYYFNKYLFSKICLCKL